MNYRVKISALPIPAGEYRREDFNQIIRKLNELIESVYNQGDLIGCSLTFIIDRSGEPVVNSSGYGLPVGGVYVDASGFLKMVQPGEAFAPSFTVRTKMGVVTAA